MRKNEVTRFFQGKIQKEFLHLNASGVGGGPQKIGAYPYLAGFPYESVASSPQSRSAQLNGTVCPCNTSTGGTVCPCNTSSSLLRNSPALSAEWFLAN
jgi:hypothetical protein